MSTTPRSTILGAPQPITVEVEYAHSTRQLLRVREILQTSRRHFSGCAKTKLEREEDSRPTVKMQSAPLIGWLLSRKEAGMLQCRQQMQAAIAAATPVLAALGK